MLQEYDIKSAEDIQEALKDLLGGTIQSMLEAEMDDHLGYAPYERTDTSNARNGKKSKTIRSKYGETNIDVPQDRESSFVIIPMQFDPPIRFKMTHPSDSI